MAPKLKFCSVNTPSAKKMLEDIGSGNVCTYTTASFSITQLTDVHPEPFLQKCVGVQVAVSGDATGDQVWMGIMPMRVDRVANGEGRLELQGDMTVLLFSGSGTTPAPSGVVAYHQGFDGQNVPLTAFSGVHVVEATRALRANLVEEKKDLRQADPQLLSTLRQTVDKVRPELERLVRESQE
jgi:hypothetical protein